MSRINVFFRLLVVASLLASSSALSAEDTGRKATSSEAAGFASSIFLRLHGALSALRHQAGRIQDSGNVLAYDVAKSWHDFWCWTHIFGECPPAQSPCAETAQAEPEGAEAALRMSSDPFDEDGIGLQQQDVFCGLEVGSTKVIDCGCCAVGTSQGDSEPTALAVLLYGGGVVQAPAWDRANASSGWSLTGVSRTWSLGGRIPRLLCDRGRPVCRCEESAKGWRVEEPTCQNGDTCALGSVPEEGGSCSSNGCAWHGGLAFTNPDPIPQGVAKCEIGEKSGRVSIGDALCEDMSVNECSRLYGRGADGSWHHCKVSDTEVRMCNARAMTMEEALQRDTAVGSWAVQHAYNPDTRWKVLFDNSSDPAGIVRVDLDNAHGIQEVRELLIER